MLGRLKRFLQTSSRRQKGFCTWEGPAWFQSQVLDREVNFWIERLIISSAGELCFRGFGFTIRVKFPIDTCCPCPKSCILNSVPWPDLCLPLQPPTCSYSPCHPALQPPWLAFSSLSVFLVDLSVDTPSLRTLSFSSLGRLILLVLTSLLFSGEASMACHTGHAPSVSFYSFLQFPLPRLVKYCIGIFFGGWVGGGVSCSCSQSHNIGNISSFSPLISLVLGRWLVFSKCLLSKWVGGVWWKGEEYVQDVFVRKGWVWKALKSSE